MGTVLAAALSAQSGANILLIVNGNSPDSKAIADYYAKRRSVPARNHCVLNTTTAETIPRSIYDSQILGPVRDCLQIRGLSETVLYLVTTLGVPLRIDGNGGRTGDFAAVDSELTLAYSQMKGNDHPLQGPMRNPFFQAVDARFEHTRFPIYLVTRLAAYDRAGVFRLIDQSLQAVNRGKIVIDMLERDQTPGNSWLEAAAKSVPADRLLLDRTPSVLEGIADVIAYASWGSNDPNRRKRHSRFRWLPGAIVTEYVSTNARTFIRPPATWEISANWTDPKALYAGSPQSLAADYLEEGVTGTSGHVYEPYLGFTPRPDLLLPAYLKGRNLAEAYYLSIPALSWQNVVIGDPLCRLR
jgi:uncharacterized protein (TIGR03790 family)